MPSTEKKTIAVLGTLDSKGEEHAFVAEQIRQAGHEALLIDVGTGVAPSVQPDITREEVAAADGLDLKAMMARQDRGECVVAMSKAAPKLLLQLVADEKIHGVISLGGGGGTAIGTAAMRALPIGFPKLMVSTLASGNTEHYVGTKDIVLMPSIVDVAGLNSVSKKVFAQAAAAISGMARVEIEESSRKPLVVASMFGNTTDCINHAKSILEEAGYEVLVFHATGTGGRTMESLIESGMVSGVLDLTTTEWADEYVGGTLGAGPTRMEATAKAKVPSVVAPGCLDMVNFGARETVPEKFAGRNFYIHNPQVTLMRTTPEECEAIGKILSEKVNIYEAPTAIMLPEKAISVISAEGQVFHDPAADHALFTAIRANTHQLVESFDMEINDPGFASVCANKLLALMQSAAH